MRGLATQLSASRRLASRGRSLAQAPSAASPRRAGSTARAWRTRSDPPSLSASSSRHGEALRSRWAPCAEGALHDFLTLPRFLPQLWEPPGINEACNVSYGSSSLWNTMTAPFTGMVSTSEHDRLTCISHLTPRTPQRFSGMVWYQGEAGLSRGPLRTDGLFYFPRPRCSAGESNAIASDPEATYYLCALPFLVSSLRTIFNSPDLHVSVIQLAPWAR